MKKTTLFVIAILCVALISGPVFADGVKKSMGQEVAVTQAKAYLGFEKPDETDVPLEWTSNARVWNVDKNKNIIITSAKLYKQGAPPQPRPLVLMRDYIDDFGEIELQPLQDFLFDQSWLELPLLANPLTLIITWISKDGDKVKPAEIGGMLIHRLNYGHPSMTIPVSIVKVDGVVISEIEGDDDDD